MPRQSTALPSVSAGSTHLQITQICVPLLTSNQLIVGVPNGGYTRVRRTEGLLRSIIGAVVHGTRRRENPS
jgi:hypothetical protein